jgi:hypothetical protein
MFMGWMLGIGVTDDDDDDDDWHNKSKRKLLRLLLVVCLNIAVLVYRVTITSRADFKSANVFLF